MSFVTADVPGAAVGASLPLLGFGAKKLSDARQAGCSATSRVRRTATSAFRGRESAIFRLQASTLRLDPSANGGLWRPATSIRNWSWPI